MDAGEFGRVLNIGLGSPILHLQQHSAYPYRDAISYACLNVTVLDPQSEGSRADYLWEVLQLTKELEYYRQPILDALTVAPISDDYLTQQLLELALKFAQQGDQQVNQIIHQKFAESVVSAWTETASVILLLDGLDGLVYVITQCLKAGSELFDDRDFALLICEAYEKFGERKTRFALRTTAQTNEPLRLLLDRLLLVQDIKVQEPPPVNETVLDEAIKAGHLPRNWKAWFAQAPDAVVTRFAIKLMNETEPRRLFRLLTLFGARPFPLDLQPLMHFAEYGDDRLDWDGIAATAINALSLISHPDVRALGLKMIAEGNRAERAVQLLENNFEAEDWQLIAALSRHLQADIEAYHSLAFAVRDIFKAHPSEVARVIFTNFYEYGACSRCRERNVEVLLKLGALPESMLEELKYDANPDLRARARGEFIV